MTSLPPPDEDLDDDPKSKTTKAKSKKKTTTTRRSSLEKQLADTLSGVGGVVTFIDEYDGQIISENAEPLAKALVELSKQNESVRKVLVAITTSGAWGGVLSILFLNIGLPIARNHGLKFPWEQKSDRQGDDEDEGEGEGHSVEIGTGMKVRVPSGDEVDGLFDSLRGEEDADS